MNQYLLQEYGAWTVMIISYVIGIFASRNIQVEGFIALAAVALLVNSKQAFTKWIRGTQPLKPLIVFILQVITALLIFIALFESDIFKLLSYLIIPAAYLLLFRLAGEHFFITELCGFALLALAVLVAKFSLTGEIDNRLYLSVAVFFIAGVFRVRVQTRKGALERVSMTIYILLSVFIYHLIKTPLIVLLPLIDNLVLSITLYSVKLKTTGWIELIKGIVFLLLTAIFL
ncbi:MAG: hypothetical protein HZC11_03765 [Nitrospirae bacterium]|nr:hypothetical protein [Nitrospirota bacterium]